MIDHSLGEFWFELYLDPDVKEYKRSIYTIWDVLGNIGGLFDMLKLLSSPIITFCTFIVGTGIDNHLIQSVFKLQKKNLDPR